MITKHAYYAGLLIMILMLQGAYGETVILDGTTATGISNLDVHGTLYDMAFVKGSFDDLNTGGNFPFLGDGPHAHAAVVAIIAALNRTSATSAGPNSSDPFTSYALPHELFPPSYWLSFAARYQTTGWEITNGTVLGEDSNSRLITMTTVVPAAVEIDVDPWSAENIVKPDSNDSIVVAVLGSNTVTGDATHFDVYQVDPDSLKLGAGQAPNIALNPLYGDYDNDTNTDAAFVFKTQDTGILCDDPNVTLRGETFGGEAFEGTATIVTTDCSSLPNWGAGTLTVLGDTDLFSSSVSFGPGFEGNQQFVLNLLGSGTNVRIHEPNISSANPLDSFFESLGGVTSNQDDSEITVHSLAGVDLLVLHIGIPAVWYTPAEELVIRDFLLTGGNVVMAADTHFNYYNIGSWNDFLNTIGSSIQYVLSDRCCEGRHFVDTILATPLTEGVDEFSISLANGLTGGTAVIQDQGYTVVAYETIAPVVTEIEVMGVPLHVHHKGQGGLPNDLVPVVVLGSSTGVGDPVDLDATLIDPASLRFGPSRALIDPASTPDLNYNHDSDGLPDAKFDFKMSDTGFPHTPGTGVPCSASPARLDGSLFTGEVFTGIDSTVSTDCVAPCH